MEDEAPIIKVLLLGSPRCGKSTFLSRLAQGPTETPTTQPQLLNDRDQPFIYDLRMSKPRRTIPLRYRLEFYDNAYDPPTPQQQQALSSRSFSTAPPPYSTDHHARDASPPPYSDLTQQEQQQSPPILQHLASQNPTSTPPYTNLSPDLIILCYDIGNPVSLIYDLPKRWRKEVYLQYGGRRQRKGDGEELDEARRRRKQGIEEVEPVDGEGLLPIMVLGLKRDLRSRVTAGDDGSMGESGIVDPLEAYRISQEMRCDRYAECSALTGELFREVFEDIVRMAVSTTKTAIVADKGGRGAGSGARGGAGADGCSVM